MKILVIDDHALIRELLRGVLGQLKPEAAILEATDAREAIRLAAENADLELVLLDLSLPDRDGFELLAELRECQPTVPIVVLSGHHDQANVVRALDLGALVSFPRVLSVKCWQCPGSGVRRRHLHPTRNLGAPGALRADNGPALRAAGTPESPRDLGLTDRQIEVLALMMQGKSNKAIARILDLAEPTVRNHVTAVLKALNVANRTEAVIAVVALGWDLRPTTRRRRRRQIAGCSWRLDRPPSRSR